jgi:hypothetical protein
LFAVAADDGVTRITWPAERWSRGRYTARVIHREHLSTGTLRLRSDDCTFLFTRLRPGALLLTVLGEDDGEFGAMVLDELEAEITRFGRPLVLFVDALGTVRVSNVVANRWTEWFEDRRDRLARVSVLVRSKTISLTMSIARHLSGTAGLFEVTSDRAAFERELVRVAPGGGVHLEAERFSRDALTIDRIEHGAGCVELRSPRCSFRLEPLAAGALLLTVRGLDTGEFGIAVVDEIRRYAREQRMPLELFVDADVDFVDAGVRDLWTQWIKADGRHVRHVTMLVGSKSTRLSIAVSREQSRTIEQIRLLDDRALFDAAVTRAR